MKRKGNKKFGIELPEDLYRQIKGAIGAKGMLMKTASEEAFRDLLEKLLAAERRSGGRLLKAEMPDIKYRVSPERAEALRKMAQRNHTSVQQMMEHAINAAYFPELQDISAEQLGESLAIVLNQGDNSKVSEQQRKVVAMLLRILTHKGEEQLKEAIVGNVRAFCRLVGVNPDDVPPIDIIRGGEQENGIA